MKADAAMLVVGADGLIGRALAGRVAAQRQAVISTTLLPQAGAEVLDLSQDLGTWRPPQRISVAYLCAAMTSLAYCHAHPRESRAINVVGTLALAETLIEQGALVVFPSSNMVFDGSTPLQKADAAPSPQSEYGRQKAEAERQLLAMPNVCVVRFTKVIPPGWPLLKSWTAALKAGQPVQPFADMVMAPVPLELAVAALYGVGVGRLQGIVQVSALQDITYGQAAFHVAACLGADRKLVQPIRTADSGWPREHIPAHTTLDTTRLRAELILTPPDAWAAIDSEMNR